MNNRGYTLIELSVVVLLIGMMLLIAVPRVRDTLIDDDLKAVTRRLISSARELRNESVREQTDYILHIDLTNPAFWVYPADTTAEKRLALRKGAFLFPEGVRIADVRQADEGKGRRARRLSISSGGGTWSPRLSTWPKTIGSSRWFSTPFSKR